MRMSKIELYSKLTIHYPGGFYCLDEGVYQIEEILFPVEGTPFVRGIRMHEVRTYRVYQKETENHVVSADIICTWINCSQARFVDQDKLVINNFK